MSLPQGTLLSGWRHYELTNRMGGKRVSTGKETKGVTKHFTVYRIPTHPPTERKNYPAQNVRGAAVDKPCSKPMPGLQASLILILGRQPRCKSYSPCWILCPLIVRVRRSFLAKSHLCKALNQRPFQTALLLINKLLIYRQTGN